MLQYLFFFKAWGERHICFNLQTYLLKLIYSSNSNWLAFEICIYIKFQTFTWDIVKLSRLQTWLCHTQQNDGCDLDYLATFHNLLNTFLCYFNNVHAFNIMPTFSAIYIFLILFFLVNTDLIRWLKEREITSQRDILFLINTTF